MNISRRWFIGGAASMGALQGCKVFTDSMGLFRSGQPNVKFGVISDVHLICANTDTGRGGNTRTLDHTLRWFDEQGVDGIVVAGDIADAGLVSELQLFADSWFKAFPNNRSSIDGRKVERVVVLGNHDWEGFAYNYDVFGRKSNTLRDDWIRDFGLKKTWDRLFNEEYSPVFKKTIKGYDFIGAHWDGDAGADWSGMHAIKPWFEKNSSSIDPSKPFFYVQHPHPKNTCYGAWAWGRDGGVSTETLSKFPNAVAFSGHSHYSLTDERTIWQGAFASLGTGSLRYSCPNNDQFAAEGGFENSPGSTNANPESEKTLPKMRTSDGRNGMLVSVFDDCTVFRRRDFRHDADLGPDWVMPNITTGEKPFAFAERARKSIAPQFDAHAVVKAEIGETYTRGAKEGVKTPSVNVSFPAVTRTFKSQAWRYDIVAEGEDGKVVAKKRLMAPAFHLPYTLAEKNCSLAFLRSKLPKGRKLRFVVTPYDCFGNAGKQIKSDFIAL
ncbi:MAG: metallophosphoesterase [Kiritimatiellae bacterium]|nr:metallophosphoesterase [Kiritimatiellia bacterium]